jgi:hypothetical protein
MKYLQSIMSHGKPFYPQIPDPYKNGRICFEVRHIDKTMIHHLLQDENFMHITDGIVYFKP